MDRFIIAALFLAHGVFVEAPVPDNVLRAIW